MVSPNNLSFDWINHVSLFCLDEKSAPIAARNLIIQVSVQCIQHVPKNPKGFLGKTGWYFLKIFLDYNYNKLYIHVILERNKHSKSCSKKVNIYKTAYNIQGCGKKHYFWVNFRRKLRTTLSITSTFLN